MSDTEEPDGGDGDHIDPFLKWFIDTVVVPVLIAKEKRAQGRGGPSDEHEWSRLWDDLKNMPRPPAKP